MVHDIRRRRLVLAAGGLIAATPLVRGQAPAKGAPKRVGCMWAGKATDASEYKPAFVSRLRELGWSEGRNLVLVQRYAEGDRGRYDALARELAAEKVDVILALFSSAVRAARKAAPDTPIVFVFVSDPVGEGFVESLARPGGNVTGASSRDVELNAKRLQLLKTLVPRASRIAVLIDALPPTGVPHYWLRALQEMVSDGKAMGLQVEHIQVSRATQIGALIERLVLERFDAARWPSMECACACRCSTLPRTILIAAAWRPTRKACPRWGAARPNTWTASCAARAPPTCRSSRPIASSW